MPRVNDSVAATPSDLIEAQAPAYEASVLRRSGDQILVELRLRRADGRIVPYRLQIDARTVAVMAKEEMPDRLPAFCLERHINPDGNFCMNWQGADPLYVTDVPAAQRWWDTLLGYLRLQERAAKLGRWPNREAWAHGDAAEHQHTAYAAPPR